MHEASIAESILDIAALNCRKAGFERVRSIRVRIGSASGVEREALLFAFECMKGGTAAEDATLEIEMAALGGTCDNCMGEFEAEGAYVLSCPLCGSNAFRITRGHEMDIVEIEVN